jgi:hypothetical protein
MRAELNKLLAMTDNLPSNQKQLHQEWNDRRTFERNDQARSLLGKCLPGDSLTDVFNETIKGPNDSFKPPPWLMAEIKEVTTPTPTPSPNPPPVRFAVDDESPAAHNGALLELFGFNFTELLDPFADITLRYGSEFRPMDQLEKIFDRDTHPNYPFFKDVLHGSMDYFFDMEIMEEQSCQAELHVILERGNHKSATSEPVITKNALHKDMHHGFTLPPFPSLLVLRLKNALVQPCGLASQFSLEADGSRLLKNRLTHHLSYGLMGGKVSVNSRINMKNGTPR